MSHESPEKKKLTMQQSEENLVSANKMPKIEIIYEKTDQTQTFTQLVTEPEQRIITSEDEKIFKTDLNVDTLQEQHGQNLLISDPY